MRIKTKSLLMLGLIPFALGACSNAKEQLGLERKSPDEFAVVKRAPLEMPPGFNLRPPSPGAPRPQEKSSDMQAKAAILGEDETQVVPSGGQTTSEALLVQQAGAQYIDPDIRAKVDQETLETRDDNRPVAEKLLGIVGADSEPPATVVNATKESERIQKNMEEGKPVTEGETPSVER